MYNEDETDICLLDLVHDAFHGIQTSELFRVPGFARYHYPRGRIVLTSQAGDTAEWPRDDPSRWTRAEFLDHSTMLAADASRSMVGYF